MRGISACAAAVACLFIASCAAPPRMADRTDFLAEATRVYAGETRERVIRAAEAVLKITDPGDWEFRHQANGFTGYRSYFVYLVIAAERGQDKWDFQALDRAGGVEASVSVSKVGVGGAGYTVAAFNETVPWLPLYRLFWKRMDYMLGKRADWAGCDAEIAAVVAAGASGARHGLYELCGPTLQGKDDVPEPLPRRSTGR